MAGAGIADRRRSRMNAAGRLRALVAGQPMVHGRRLIVLDADRESFRKSSVPCNLVGIGRSH